MMNISDNYNDMATAIQWFYDKQATITKNTNSYDDTTGFLDAMDILAQGQVMNFIERFPDFNPTFNNAVFNAVAHLEKEICSGAVVDPWSGKNYIEKGERILPRLKALKDDETLLFVYGTLMSGQSAHEILNESTYRMKILHAE